MKRLKLAAIAAVGALALTGCGKMAGEVGEVRGGNDGTVTVLHVEHEPGKDVTCVWRKAGSGGGLSCDWQGAER